MSCHWSRLPPTLLSPQLVSRLTSRSAHCWGPDETESGSLTTSISRSLTTPPLTTAFVPSPPPLALFAPSSVLISVASLLPEAEQEARQELPPATVKHPRFLKVAENFFIALQSDERVNYQLDVKFQESYLSKVVNLLQCQLSEGATSSKNSKGEGNENGICKNGIDAEDVGEGEHPDSHAVPVWLLSRLLDWSSYLINGFPCIKI
ncbi:hypothetical protein ACFE04_024378 [Oxalis oulophora]